jgi:hypothetical protein
MLVEFQTGASKTQFSGFAANFYTNDLCPCGDAGICTDTSCVCNAPGKLAPNCTQDAQVISLASGEYYTGTIDNWNWLFFSFSIQPLHKPK